MIDLPLLLAFLAAATILTITPGVDTAMVLRSATIDGRRAALFTALGIMLGCLVWGAAVSLGLGAVLQASELAYAVIKLGGAAYLVWLGGNLLFRPRTALGPVDARRGGASAAMSFRRGLFTNLLNPKIGIFYVTFLPQFVPAGVNFPIYSFGLACLYVLLTVVWFGALIAATVPLGAFLRRPGAVRALDRLTGGVFVLFGMKLATSSAR